jgi:hypothetical protein
LSLSFEEFINNAVMWFIYRYYSANMYFEQNKLGYKKTDFAKHPA